MPRLLLLCTGNSCRSQMAEGLIRPMLPEGWEVFSAGIRADGLHPLSVRAMAEVDVDISGAASNRVQDFRGKAFRVVLSLCDHARAVCPWYPEGARRVHRHFPDPADAMGTEEERLEVYRRSRNEMAAWLPGFVLEELSP